MIARWLFWFARAEVSGALVRFGFRFGAKVLPVRRIALTERVIAFHHPRPSWETHVLLVPRVGITSLMHVDAGNMVYVRDTLRLAGRTVDELSLGMTGLSLVINGGAYQDVGQLHAHLIAGTNVPRYAYPRTSSRESLVDTLRIEAFLHPEPQREVHVVLRLKDEVSQGADRDGWSDAGIDAIVSATQDLVRQLDLAEQGYSLMATVEGESRNKIERFHLVSGRWAPEVAH